MSSVTVKFPSAITDYTLALRVKIETRFGLSNPVFRVLFHGDRRLKKRKGARAQRAPRGSPEPLSSHDAMPGFDGISLCVLDHRSITHGR